MQVTLFRDLPGEAWPSMDRYADELEAALRRLGCAARSFAPALPWRRLPGRLNAWANYAWRSLVYPGAARRRQGEINHVLDHTYAHLLDTLAPARTVVTCHDVAPLACGPSGLGLAARLWRRSFAAMQRAARVLTPSAFTRAELLQHAAYPAARVSVVPYGVSREFRRPAPPRGVAALRAKYAPDERPLLLHVGSCAPRKNVEAILRALPALRDLRPAFVQVGGQFSPAQRALAAAAPEVAVAQPGGAFGADLAAWYQAAALLIVPSLYEGFGLPVVEAMAAGTPVACAQAAALPEVAGGAALLFDPREPEALAAAVRSLLTDPALRRSLVERGLSRSRQFTWDETARRALQAYEEVYADAAAARSAG